MKKSMIAGTGIAALAMAALPFAGVFAAQTTDHITLTVQSGCTLASSRADNSVVNVSLGDVTPGTASAEVQSGTAITTTCNDAFTVSATTTGLAGSGTAAGETIPAGNAAGPASSLGTKIAVTGTGVAAASAFDNQFGTIGTTATTVATGSAAVDGATITPTYKAFVATTAKPGTYTGDVVYTISTN